MSCARRAANYDGVCFHAQQCAEKYLKALLQEADIRFGKIHNLPALLDAIGPRAPELESMRADMRELTLYAVDFRYPGASATKELAAQAVRQCKRIREAVRSRLGLKTPAAGKRAARKKAAKPARKRKRGGDRG